MKAKVVSHLYLQHDLILLVLGITFGIALGVLGTNLYLRAKEPPFEYHPQPSEGPVTLNKAGEN